MKHYQICANSKIVQVLKITRTAKKISYGLIFEKEVNEMKKYLLVLFFVLTPSIVFCGEGETKSTNFTLIANLVAACGSAAAAVAAWKAANAAKDAVRTQIILEFSRRDAEPEMGRKTKMLWDFKSEKKVEDIAERFEQLKSKDHPRWEKIDDARRVVHKYFTQLMRARLAGLITEKEILASFTHKPQLKTVIEILEPLESKKPGHTHTKPIFEEYKRIYRDYEALNQRYFGCQY